LLRLSVKHLIIAPILVLVGCSYFVVSKVLVDFIKESHVESFTESNLAYVGALIPTIAHSIWEFDTDEAEHTLHGMDNKSTFLFAAVYTDGVIFAANGEAPSWESTVHVFDDGSSVKMGDGRYRFVDDMLVVTYPVILVSQEQELGELMAAFSLNQLVADGRRIEQTVRSIAAGGAFVVFVGLFGVAWFANRWLGRIAIGITNIANGELSETVDLSSPIIELQDINDALWQLRKDARRLIELRSQSRAAEQIRHMALHDALTGLGNRRYLDEFMIEFEGAHSEDEHDFLLELLHIDLDGFKEVNDRAGHAVGDDVLKIVGVRLRELAAETAQVFRVGGDEFVIIRQQDAVPPSDNGHPTALAAAVIQSLAEPYLVNGGTFTVGASVGIVTTPVKGIDFEAALIDADIAMYAAKAAGKNGYVEFTPEIGNAAAKKINLALELKAALSNGEFKCYYQPKVSRDGFVLCGAEALVRWYHPELGILAPDAFLPLADERGMGDEIDREVFQQVCRDIKSWQAQGFDVPRISINLSAKRMSDPDLIEELTSATIDPNLLSFELLETSYLDDVSDEILGRLDELRHLGVLIEIDDFGSGYASMLSLLEIGPDILKIDRKFVQTMGDTEHSAHLIAQIIKIGNGLNIKSTAEGVETLEQATVLVDMGCDVLQGYYFGRPCPPETFAAEYLTGLV